MPDDGEFDELQFMRLQREAAAERERYEEWYGQERARWAELLAADQLAAASMRDRQGTLLACLPDEPSIPGVDREGVLRRLRGSMCALLEVADRIASADTPPGEYGLAAGIVRDVGIAVQGRTPEMIAALSLVDRIARWAPKVAEGLKVDEAVFDVVLGMSHAGYPETADALRADDAAKQAIGDALRAWAEGSSHWAAVAVAVERAGLGGRDPESLRRQWAAWRRDPVRPPVIL